MTLGAYEIQADRAEQVPRPFQLETNHILLRTAPRWLAALSLGGMAVSLSAYTGLMLTWLDLWGIEVDFNRHCFHLADTTMPAAWVLLCGGILALGTGWASALYEAKVWKNGIVRFQKWWWNGNRMLLFYASVAIVAQIARASSTTAGNILSLSISLPLIDLFILQNHFGHPRVEELLLTILAFIGLLAVGGLVPQLHTDRYILVRRSTGCLLDAGASGVCHAWSNADPPAARNRQDQAAVPIDAKL